MLIGCGCLFRFKPVQHRLIYLFRSSSDCGSRLFYGRRSKICTVIAVSFRSSLWWRILVISFVVLTGSTPDLTTLLIGSCSDDDFLACYIVLYLYSWCYIPFYDDWGSIVLVRINSGLFLDIGYLLNYYATKGVSICSNRFGIRSVVDASGGDYAWRLCWRWSGSVL